MKGEPNLKSMLQTAELDQAATGLSNMARMLATFYQELIKNNVPSSLAEQLTADYFGTMLEKMFP